MKDENMEEFTVSSAEIDVSLTEQLSQLAKENHYKEYLDLLNENLEKVEITENYERLLYLPNYLDPAIRIKLVDLRLNDEENDSRLYLREEVVKKLNLAQHSLPEGYYLLIADALRTEQIVLGLYRHYFEKKKQENPTLSDKEIDLWLRNLLAMPDDPVPPGHMTGGAIDVVLVDVHGEKIQMEIDTEIIPKEQQKFTFCDGLPEHIANNRMILLNAMTNVGFYNYSREYWHYSYGEAYWAVRRIIKKACYGIANDTLKTR